MSALGEIFKEAYVRTWASFLEDEGTCPHAAAQQAWEGTESLLEADVDYLLPSWRSLGKWDLFADMQKDDELWSRFRAYVNLR